MKINVQTILHGNQRYETCGDWWFDENGDLQVRVSEMGNIYYEYLVADHEIREAMLCKKMGISEESVSEFDMKFEEERLLGKHSENAEPGDSPKAPYQKPHKFATKIEKLTAKELDIDWKQYDNSVFSL